MEETGANLSTTQIRSGLLQVLMVIGTSFKNQEMYMY